MNDNQDSKDKQIQELQKRVSELETKLQGTQATDCASCLLARLPAYNPNPIVQVSSEGIILYHNQAAARLPGWHCETHILIPMPLRLPVGQAWAEKRTIEQDILLEGRTYSVSFVPVPEEGCVNLYGRDITEYKEAERALAASEKRQREISRLLELDQARLATVLRHLPVGIWIVDGQGRLTGSNPEADRIWGGEPPFLDKIDDYEHYVCWRPGENGVLPPEEHPIPTALRTHEFVAPHELAIRRFDGSQGIVLASAVPIKDSQGRLMGVVGVNIDITENKRMEEALRRSEERLAKAFRASPDAIVMSRVSDGLILEVSDGWRKLFGHQPEEVMGQTTLALGLYVNPQDREKIRARLQEQGFLHDVEVQMRCKSGEIRQVSLSVENLEIDGVYCWLSILRDITERKQAEQALRESEWRLRRAQEIAHLGSWELDLVQDRLTWSDEVYRIFGLVPQQFAATYEAFLEAVHPQDRAAVDAAYAGSIQAGQDTYEIEHRVIRPLTGEIRFVHEKCEHFRDAEGRIVRSIGMVHDITEWKLAEAALRQQSLP